jgi:hypothetical protein
VTAERPPQARVGVPVNEPQERKGRAKKAAPSVRAVSVLRDLKAGDVVLRHGVVGVGVIEERELEAGAGGTSEA